MRAAAPRVKTAAAAHKCAPVAWVVDAVRLLVCLGRSPDTLPQALSS